MLDTVEEMAATAETSELFAMLVFPQEDVADHEFHTCRE